MSIRNKPTKSWMEKSKFEIEHEEENIAKKKKILEILRYLEENNISQEKFAEEIGISAEDAGRFFHGQDLNDSNAEKIWRRCFPEF